jgi:hypothetical protein
VLRSWEFQEQADFHKRQNILHQQGLWPSLGGFCCT